MDIEILSYDYPPNDGGISRLTAAVGEELQRRGVTVAVLTLAASQREGPARPLLSTHDVSRSLPAREWMTWRYLLSLDRSSTLLATVWNPEATIAWISRRRPYYVMAHGNEVMAYPPGMRYTLKNALRQRVLGQAKGVICNSRYTEALVRALQPRARTHVIFPAVDAERFAATVDRAGVRARFGLPADKRLILSVSRLNAYKGHDVILKALASLPESVRSQLHYAVAGNGEHLPALQGLAADLGIRNSVSWLGFVADDDLPGLYGAADLFALCTREDPAARGVEGFGMVFLEAQAAGIPVLGTHAGGIPDAIVEGQGGWLVQADDSDAVAAHFESLALDVTPFRQQGLWGRRRARTETTWPRYVDRLVEILQMEGM